jgi:hypothetical protein
VTTRVLQARLLFLAFAAFAPLAANAQISDNCETYYCTAYATYNTGNNTISGYLEYYDDTEDVNLGIDVYVGSAYLGSDDGVDDVEYDITAFNRTAMVISSS